MAGEIDIVDAQISPPSQVDSELPIAQLDETHVEEDIIVNLLQSIDNQSDSSIPSAINLNSIDTGFSDTSNCNDSESFTANENTQTDEEQNETNYEQYLFDLSAEYSQQNVSSYPSLTESTDDNQTEHLIESDIDEEITENEIVSANHSAAAMEMEAMITSTRREAPTLKLNSDEKYFGLSLFGTLRRLTPLQQQAAKLHILTYLTKMEYGEHATLE